MRAPDTGRPSPAPGGQRDMLQRGRNSGDRPEQKDERRGFQPDDKSKDLRPVEKSDAGAEKHRQRAGNPGLRQDDREQLQERVRQGGSENQQPVQRGGQGASPERGRPDRRDGSFDNNNRSRQQLHPVQQTYTAITEKSSEQEVEKSRQRSDHA